MEKVRLNRVQERVLNSVSLGANRNLAAKPFNVKLHTVPIPLSLSSQQHHGYSKNGANTCADDPSGSPALVSFDLILKKQNMVVLTSIQLLDFNPHHGGHDLNRSSTTLRNSPNANRA